MAASTAICHSYFTITRSLTRLSLTVQFPPWTLDSFILPPRWIELRAALRGVVTPSLLLLENGFYWPFQIFLDFLQLTTRQSTLSVAFSVFCLSIPDVKSFPERAGKSTLPECAAQAHLLTSLPERCFVGTVTVERSLPETIVNRTTASWRHLANEIETCKCVFDYIKF